jgi:hypothetical protein
MRRSFHLLTILLFSYVRVDAQVGYSPEVGVGMSSMHFAPPFGFTSATISPLVSGKVGGLVDIPLNKHLYFQAGLSFSSKGAVRAFSYYRNDSFNESVNQTLHIYYADLPVNVVFKSGHQGRGRFVAGLGATPSYIIAGKNKLSDNFDSSGIRTVTNDNLNIIRGQTVKGFDIGMNLTAGYELPTGLFFRLYYTFGIQDIGPGSEIDKNRVWGISAGYLFGKGRNVNKEASDLIDKTTD